jgi:hypothetical protein
MSDLKPKPGSFTAYLEYARRDRGATAATPASPLTLIEILAALSTPALPMAELQARSAMEPTRYREALKSLREAGYVEIDGPPLDEVVLLTGKGAEAARLARPA